MKKTTLLLISVLFLPAYLHAAMGDYCSAPPYVTRSIAPNLLVLLDNSMDMYQPAYYVAPTGTAGVYDGALGQDDYAPNATADNYMGYFVPAGCYKYGGNSFSEQLNTSVTPNRSYNATEQCPTTAPYRGNLLNWATMSQYDLVETIIIGGHSSPEQVSPGNSTGSYTLKSPSSYQWTKYYPSKTIPTCVFKTVGANLTISDYTAGSCEYLNSPPAPTAFLRVKEWLKNMYAMVSVEFGKFSTIFSSGWHQISVAAADIWERSTFIARAWAAGGTCALGPSSGTSMSATVGVGYTLGLDASGTTGSANYTWSTGTWPSWLTTTPVLSGSKNSTAKWTSTPASCGTSNFTATVNNTGCGSAVSYSNTITVNSSAISYTPPASPLTSGTINVAYSQNMGAPGGGLAPYTWSATNLPAGLSINSSTGVISGTPTAAGTYTGIVVTLQDSGGGCARGQQTISTTYSLTINPANLTITNSPSNGQVGTAYSVAMTASGGYGSYTWSATGLPAGLSINSAGVISGTPTTSGTSSATITVKDSWTPQNSKSGTYSITISTSALTITNAPTDGTEGSAYSVTMTASGGTGSYTWSASGLPSGLSINSATGLISGTPPAGSAGLYNPIVTVNDGSTAYSKTYTLRIRAQASSALAITTAGLSDAVKGSLYSFTATATGGTTPYTWSATGLPASLSINSSTGVISGTPTNFDVTGSPYSVTIKVTDAVGTSDSKTFNLNVIAVSGPTPVITTTALPDGAVNTAYSFSFTGSGGTTPYTWTATGLPATLTLNSSTGVISGVLSTSDVGPHTVTVTLTDNHSNTATKAFTLNVTAPTPYITTTGLPDGTVGSAYSYTLSGTGGVTPYTWTITGGSLPASLTLNPSTGVISGTPLSGDVGTYSVTIQIKDQNLNTRSRAFTFNITPPALAILTTSLPDAEKGTAYSYTLTGSGGTTPYTWNATGLPAGLSINSSTGVISGTPTTIGTYTVTVNLTDANGKTASSTFTLNVLKSLKVRSSASMNVWVDRLEEAGTDLNGNDVIDGSETWGPDANGNSAWDGKKGIFQQFYDVNNPKARWGVGMFDKNAAFGVGSPTTACIPATPAQPFYSNVQNALPTAPVIDLSNGLYGALNYYSFGNPYDPSQSSYKGCSNSDPIDNVPCRKNFVLIITAGKNVGDGTSSHFVSSGCTVPNGNNTAPLVQNACFGYSNDLRTDKAGKQNVYTYIVNTMGKNATNNLILQDAAAAGGGKYYPATNASDLAKQLTNALTDILAQASSGTAVSVLTTSSRGVGSMTQAYFLPSTLEGSRSVWWTGYTSQIWIDPFDNLREDTVNDYNLKLAEDNVMRTYFDSATNDTKAAMFTTDADGYNGTLASCTPSSTKLFSQIQPIWEAGKKLALTSPSQRTIFTSSKVINGAATTNTFSSYDFSVATISSDAALSSAINPDATFTLSNIVGYVRGECLETGVTGDTACGDTPNTTFRDRRLTIKDSTGTVIGDPNGNVWKLGDVISSTPKVVSNAPANTYNIDYGDSSYYQYFTSDAYKQRSAMAITGANDGMLHAFRVGYMQDKSDANYTLASQVKAVFKNFFSDTSVPTPWSSSDKLGKEVWSYIPFNSFPYLKYLADTAYCHIYFNDLSPRIVDASIGGNAALNGSAGGTLPTDTRTAGNWKTIVLGGMRFGGACNAGTPSPPVAGAGFSSYYALDITDPEHPVPMWEFSDSDLGYSTSFPAVVRTGDKNKNGNWYVAIGSGSTQLPKSGTDIARGTTGYIYLLDLKTGALIQKIGLGGNEIVGDIVAIDADKNYASEKIYFGSANTATGSWGGSLFSIDIPNQDLSAAWTPTKKILFTGAYPFTASPDIAKDTDGNVWVYEGSGKYYSDNDEADTSGQIFIGLKDKTSGITYPLHVADLTDTSTISTTGTVTGTAQMCNYNSTSGTFGLETVVTSIQPTSAAAIIPVYGWRFPLTSGERVISRPLAVGGLVDFLTYKPKSDPCAYGGDSYLYSLGYTTGVAPYSVAIRSSSVTGGVTTAGSAVTVKPGVLLGPGAPPTGEAIIIPPPKEGETTLKKKIQVATGVIVEAENSPVNSVVSKIVHWLKK